MSTQSSQMTGQNSKRTSWGRETAAELMAAFRALQGQGWSQRQFADEQDVARTTLQQWLNRAANMEAPPEVVAFFESPAGLAFLHRLLVSAHLVMNNMGNCGIRLVSLMLRLAGVGPFVGLSYGSQQKVATNMQEAIVQYEAEQRPQLAAQMPHKNITVCEDETFPAGGLCLVAMEPVSGFIVLEQYSDKRDAETWNMALEEATRDLPLEIIQSTSDEARALLRHAKDQEAHHSPDLFHVQHEINAALVLPLKRRTAQAEEAVAQALDKLQHEESRRADYEEGPRPRGRPPAFEQHISAARHELERARGVLLDAQDWQEIRKDAVAGIARSYHPYNLDTGERRDAHKLQAELDASFEALRWVADEADLSEKSQKSIDKAQRVVAQMVATSRFFHDTVRKWVESSELPAEQESLLHEILIPTAYLRNAANRASMAETASEIHAVADSLQRPLHDPSGVWVRLNSDQRRKLTKLAQKCADLFQRSSSCVEGRNSRLGLWEHALRHVSGKKLSVLTIVQNYFTKRPEGTTAAERFFGAAPADLFEYLLNNMDMPPRPRRGRGRSENTRQFHAAL